ncbi:MAG: hypothetical protein ACFFAN_18240 [Promethearchaeota archaeon]
MTNGEPAPPSVCCKSLASMIFVALAIMAFFLDAWIILLVACIAVAILWAACGFIKSYYRKHHPELLVVDKTKFDITPSGRGAGPDIKPPGGGAGPDITPERPDNP